MTAQKNIILTSEQIEQKTKRIAYQIYESNSSENDIIIAGIADNGFTFATKIAEHLANISTLNITMCKVTIDKKNPLNPITTSIESINRNHKKYPVKADYKGVSLSTTLQEHVNVEFYKDGSAEAYLL